MWVVSYCLSRQLQTVSTTLILIYRQSVGHLITPPPIHTHSRPTPTPTHSTPHTHTQAYRLEPLINPLYAQIKPVRIDSGSKISKDALDHAEGTKAKPQLQTVQGKSWFSSLALFASNTASKTMRSSPEPARAKSIDKVVPSGGGVGGVWPRFQVVYLFPCGLAFRKS